MESPSRLRTFYKSDWEMSRIAASAIFLLLVSTFCHANPLLRADTPMHCKGSDGETLEHIFVELSINTKQSYMMLDTGGTGTYLFSAFARKQGFSLQSTSHKDRYGLSGISAQMGKFEFKLDTLVNRVFVQDLPTGIEAGDSIAGLMSPQVTFPNSYIVIDCINSRFLTLEGSPNEIDTWVKDRYPDYGRANLKRYTTDRFNPSYEEVSSPLIAEARISNHPIAPFIFDTGAFTGSIFMDYLDHRDHVINSRETYLRLDGTKVHPQLLRQQHLFLNHRKTAATDFYIETRPWDIPDPIKGTVGLDILREFVLMIPPSQEQQIMLLWHE